MRAPISDSCQCAGKSTTSPAPGCDGCAPASGPVAKVAEDAAGSERGCAASSSIGWSAAESLASMAALNRHKCTRQ